MQNSFNLQAQGVFHEYERALRDGATEKAAKIRHANPDLKHELDSITRAFSGNVAEAAS